jgi:hypothetical protein
MYKLNFAENIFTWQPTSNKILLNLFNGGKYILKRIRRTVCVLEIIWTEFIMEQTKKTSRNRFESNSIKAMQIICHTNVI